MTTETLSDPAQTITDQLGEAEVNAWKSLAGYKFVMFGYWAGVWVHLNRIAVSLGHKSRPNPFKEVVRTAKRVVDENAAPESAQRAGPGLTLFQS